MYICYQCMHMHLCVEMYFVTAVSVVRLGFKARACFLSLNRVLVFESPSPVASSLNQVSPDFGNLVPFSSHSMLHWDDSEKGPPYRLLGPPPQCQPPDTEWDEALPAVGHGWEGQGYTGLQL